MAFKMKGSPMKRNFGIGDSPTKFSMSDVKKYAKKAYTKAKRVGEKVYDEASAVGMGLKARSRAGDRNVQKGIASQSLENVNDAFRKAYRKEKAADKAMRAKQAAERKAKKTKKTTGKAVKLDLKTGKSSPATKKTSVLRPKIKGTNIKTVKVKKKKVKPAITEGVETESMQSYITRTKKARGRKRALKNTGKKIVKGVKKFLSKK